MSQKRMIAAFVGILLVGLLLRLLIFDIVVLSNFDLFPKFQAGEALLVSRISSPKAHTWVLIKNHPIEGNYSVRRLGDEIEPGKWQLSNESLPAKTGEKTVIFSSEILGRVVMTLWAFPCRTSSELCSQTSYKILTFAN